MTYQQHYDEAERLIAQSTDSNGNPSSGNAGTHFTLAQVHATLALAAATAQVAADEDRIAGTVDESGTRILVGARPA